jgi:hypothetical protein
VNNVYYTLRSYPTVRALVTYVIEYISSEPMNPYIPERLRGAVPTPKSP